MSPSQDVCIFRYRPEENRNRETMLLGAERHRDNNGVQVKIKYNNFPGVVVTRTSSPALSMGWWRVVLENDGW